MEGVSQGKNTQISGFVFNDTVEAKKIAARAGMSYEDFWTEAFKIKGRAMAEMGLYLGFLVTSNHAQNFRWELDSEGKLTGKVVFIDLSDGRPIEVIHKAQKNQQFLEKWNKYVSDSNPVRKGNTVYFSNFFRGDHNSEIDQKWHKIMREGVIERVSEILNVPNDQLEELVEYNSNPVSWRINMDENDVIKKAFASHLKILSLVSRSGCNRAMRGFFSSLENTSL